MSEHRKDLAGGARPLRHETRGERFARRYTETVRKNAEEARQQAAFRLSDDLERAKRFLRSKGWNVFEASVVLPGVRDKWFVGQKTYDRAGVIACAKREGWKDEQA